MKKTIALLLTLTMLFCLVPNTLAYEEADTLDPAPITPRAAFSSYADILKKGSAYYLYVEINGQAGEQKSITGTLYLQTSTGWSQFDKVSASGTSALVSNQKRIYPVSGYYRLDVTAKSTTHNSSYSLYYTI